MSSMSIWKFLAAVMAMPLASAGSSAAPADNNMHVYFGTYTGGKSRGIYRSNFDASNGALGAAELVAETTSPSFLALAPGGRFLYAANETDNYQGEKAGFISAFGLDPATGALRALNQQSSRGAHPCHLTVDKTGRWVLVANYSGGNVAVLPAGEDGSLGPASCTIQHEGWSADPQRQKGPHAHSINLDAPNRFAVAADLGTDKLIVYRFDPVKGQLENAFLSMIPMVPGTGPRHFAFHPNGRWAFAINELSQTISSFRYDSRRGEMAHLTNVSTLPDGVKIPGNSTAEVRVHPGGKFLYGSNRGHDSIAVVKIEKAARRLVLVENAPTLGKTPRNFGIDPTGRWLLAANQGSDSVVVFAIDPKTGRLTPTGGRIEVGAPVCVTFLAAK